MELRNNIEKLTKELVAKKKQLLEQEKNCKHIWGEIINDPETVKEAVYSHLEGHGSDPYPVYNYYDKQKQRWSRTCKNCGKKEYTYELQPTKYEPKF